MCLDVSFRCVARMVKSNYLPFGFLPYHYSINLFTKDSHGVKEFRTNIVQYKPALAFTSLGVTSKVDQSVLGHGSPVFHIHGKLRHLSGSYPHFNLFFQPF